MNQIVFYNLEKQTEKSIYRLSILAGTSYEEAILACQEFVEKLQELMAAEIARKELALKKESDAKAAVAKPVDLDNDPANPELME